METLWLTVNVHFQVGNEFGSVEALWSQFEGVMGNRDDQDISEGQECRQTEFENGQGVDEEKS